MIIFISYVHTYIIHSMIRIIYSKYQTRLSDFEKYFRINDTNILCKKLGIIQCSDILLSSNVLRTTQYRYRTKSINIYFQYVEKVSNSNKKYFGTNYSSGQIPKEVRPPKKIFSRFPGLNHPRLSSIQSFLNLKIFWNNMYLRTYLRSSI